MESEAPIFLTVSSKMVLKELLIKLNLPLFPLKQYTLVKSLDQISMSMLLVSIITMGLNGHSSLGSRQMPRRKQKTVLPFVLSKSLDIIMLVIEDVNSQGLYVMMYELDKTQAILVTWYSVTTRWLMS